MTAPDITELGERWNAARLAFDAAIEAFGERSGEVSDRLPWPFITHGKRGCVYTSEREIDADRRLSRRTKEGLKAKLATAQAAHDALFDRLGLGALEDAVNATSSAVGELGQALADDRSGTLPAIVTKLEVLSIEVQDGSDMSGYAGGLLAAALSDAKAMSAGPADDLAALHREWCAISDAADGYHNGPRETRPGQPDYDRKGELEELIAAHPDTSLAASVIRLDVMLGVFVGSVLYGALEMLEEGAIAGGARGLEALQASAPHVECWTLKARQRGMERLAAWRAKEALPALIGEVA